MPSLRIAIAAGLLLASCATRPVWWVHVGGELPDPQGGELAVYFALPGRELSDRMEQDSLGDPAVLDALRAGGFRSLRLDGFAHAHRYARWVGSGEGMGLVVLDAEGRVRAARPGPQDPPELAAWLTFVAARRGEVADARAALAAAPDDGGRALALGRLLLELGCRKETEVLLRQAATAGVADAVHRLARLYALEGRLERAREWLAKAPPSPAADVTAGYLLYKERRHAEAAQRLAAAIAAGGLGDELPRARLFLGKALHESGRDAEATAVLLTLVRDAAGTTFAGAAQHTLHHITDPDHGHTH